MDAFQISSSREATRASVGDHCYKNRQCYGGCCGLWSFILIIFLAISWDVVEPTQYALLRNGITGVVDMQTTYGAGRYFVGPFMSFIHFPSNYVTLSFGNRSRDDQRAIPARTGADTSSADSSGGQPVSLSISFQYQLNENDIPRLYQTYGTQYQTFFLRFAQQAITNAAQMFTPSSFWTSREVVQSAFHAVCNRTLVEEGFATVPELQLRAVGFQSIYEQTITSIQLQEQLRVTKTYQLEVTRVSTQVDILQSEASATVLEINAEAARERTVIVGQANADALELEQSMRARMYAQLRQHLNWGAPEFLQYIKMKALNAQPQSNVVVGVNPVGGVAAG